jgi:AcrR family transcriptional regulator
LRCVARWGIAKTTVEDVAREAGCGRATIYRAFPGGKAEVLNTTLQHELARGIAAIDDAARPLDSLEDVLVAGTTTTARLIRDHEALQFVLNHEPMSAQPFVAFDRMARVYAAAAACAAPHLARFLPEDQVASAAEWVTRVVLTYTFNPAPSIDLCDEADARRFVRTYVLPALVPNTAARSSR